MRSTSVRNSFLLLSILMLGSAQTMKAQKAYVYDVLRNEASARSTAMGGAFVTVMNDPAGIFYNPALLVSIDTAQASFTFFKHLLDINSGSATFATNIEDIGHVGAAVSYNDFGTFERRDKNGQEVGEFGSSDIVVLVGWGTTLGEGFSAGLNAKAIFSTIDTYGSSALALDGGLLYSDTASRLQAGLSLLNLGAQLSSFGDSSEPLPLDLKVGVSHQLRGLPLLIALNFTRLLDPTDDFLHRFSSFDIGGEFTISRPLRLRVGYNNRIRQDVPLGSSKGLSGLAAGIGIVVKSYRLDYAFSSFDRIGGQHRVTINAMF
nr:outer membrane protein transport protein (OMPP1/FadL/TodX) [uncultured bacterium]